MPACVVVANADTGPVSALRDFPGGEVLIAAEKGLFVAREVSGKVTVAPAADADTGAVSALHDFPGGGVLIAAAKGWFLAREVSGKVIVAPAGAADTGAVPALHDFPGGGLLIGAAKGLFVVREVGGKVTVAPVADTDSGAVSALHDFPGGGVLIGAEKGLFLAREVSGKVTVEPLGDVDTGAVWRLHDFPGGRLLIGAENGLFLAREVSGKVTVAPAADTGAVSALHDFPGSGVLIQADKGWFLAHEVSSKLTVAPAGDADTGPWWGLHDFPGGEVLIAAAKGFFLAREVGGKVTVAPAADTGAVWSLRDFPGGGVLIQADKGWFLAREVSGKVTVAPASDADTGAVQELHDFPSGGVLIGAAKGLFVVREVGGKVTVAPAGDTDTGTVRWLHDFPGGRALIGAEKGTFLTVSTSLSRAQVDIRDRKSFDGSLTDPGRTFFLIFTIKHDCAPSADHLGLKLRVGAPGDALPGKVKEFQLITPGGANAELAISSKFDTPGQWSYQVVATSGGVERLVGKPQIIAIAGGPWWKRWWELLVTCLGIGVVLANLILFGLARRSPWAWRLATDDSWSTWVLRVATVAISHIPLAQLWILDLYFKRVRGRAQKPRPFLPVPLTATEGSLQASAEAIAPPWKGRRLWVQGGSGMGKTALFKYITESHFRDYETAFAAHAHWGCILVAFAARDFSSGGDDKDDPAWVIDAVRATLSSDGLTFASSALLSRMLESGTFAVAIDGLNEVDRTRAVVAFSRTFSEAPMLITSQQPGTDRFITWRLPADVRGFTSDLLRLYLTSEQAEDAMKRITASGLKDSIRSGYDVRLVIDLMRPGPNGPELPADRMGLYTAVINAGWPDVPEGVRQEQQSQITAAAWRMVSERKPNEDMRRLKPDVDLPADLLIALADAPEKDSRSVRIIRRVDAGAFEFVHDQMHAYLAARWFAQDGFSTSELEKMVAGSTIWTQTPDARRTLWGFVAALLDNERLIELRSRIEDKEEWDILRRALKAEAERRGLNAPPKVAVELI
jgi:hypothetical protein